VTVSELAPNELAIPLKYAVPLAQLGEASFTVDWCRVYFHIGVRIEADGAVARVTYQRAESIARDPIGIPADEVPKFEARAAEIVRKWVVPRPGAEAATVGGLR
jgi:hypothetical protein